MIHSTARLSVVDSQCGLQKSRGIFRCTVVNDIFQPPDICNVINVTCHQIPEAPKESVVFMEDLPEDEQDVTGLGKYGAGESEL